MKRVAIIYFLLVNCVQGTFAQSPYVDSLKQVLKLHPEDTIGVNASLNLISEFLRIDLNKAKEYTFQTIPVATSLNHVSAIGSSYHYLTIIYQSSAKQDSAVHFLNQLELLANAHPDNWKLRMNYNQSAGLYYKNQGYYKKALPFLLDNLRFAQSGHENTGGLFLNIGNAYFNLADYRNAMHYHLEGLAIFEKVNSLRGQSFCLQSLGNDFFHLNQFELSKKYYLQAIKMKEQLNDKRGLLTSWTGAGDVYRELGQYSLAEKYYSQAILAAGEMKLPGEELRGLHQIGLLYKRTGDFGRARGNIAKSLELAEQMGDSSVIARAKSELVGVDMAQKSEKANENTLMASLKTMIEAGNRDGELVEYSRLSEYYAGMKQFEKAFEYQKKYEALKEEIEGTEVLMELKELEGQYQTEKKEKEIELLKKDQQLQALALERERANVIIIAIVLASVVLTGFLLVNRYRVVAGAKRIIEMERMRNAIARDLHDDIGSTLSSINIISQLALKENNGHSGQYFQSIHEHSSKIMESMSDIVWSINPNNDSLEQVLVKMKEFAAEILEPKGIAFSFQGIDEVKNIVLASEKRKNVFLIFKEAINNAAKYSNASKIIINVAGQNGNIIFSISDNGDGFDPEKVKPGNGLKNMEARAKSLVGALSRTSAIGNGTHINLEFPIT
ncbi:MAG: tetratricopeptide repeat protein [Imperialibacter sp.]|uniref:tetratricopeptide repeat-containing sensor histidine kinase n=1 Tax=Imperialibacter sp. TaxID=2038411 RepID=UPI0032EB2ACC